ncbi:MAG: peptidoglycan-binding protein [Cyanobacteria bacterium J06560_2]
MNSLLYHLSQRNPNATTFREISPYAKGPGVRQLQRDLNRRFELLGVSAMTSLGLDSLRIDGWFGRETLSAVKYVQCISGLPVNGHVTARTYAFITRGVAGLEPLSLGSTGIGVLALKQVLAVETEIAIAHDGRFCQFTERAVMAYQRSLGLVCDGVVGTETWGAVVRSRLGGLPCIVLLPSSHTLAGNTIFNNS